VGSNDVQNKINSLANVANNPSMMSQVDPGLAAALLAHGKGIELGGGAFGAHASIDTSRVNEELYASDLKQANPATRAFVTNYIAAHEAITQLPRLHDLYENIQIKNDGHWVISIKTCWADGQDNVTPRFQQRMSHGRLIGTTTEILLKILREDPAKFASQGMQNTFLLNIHAGFINFTLHRCKTA